MARRFNRKRGPGFGARRPVCKLQWFRHTQSGGWARQPTPWTEVLAQVGEEEYARVAELACKTLTPRTADSPDGRAAYRAVMQVPKPRRPRSASLFAKAEKVFGTTHDPREAGYILPDGSMLDLSEKREGGPRGQRSADHRTVARLFKGSIAGGDAMLAFMSHGAIRMQSYTGELYLDVAENVKPTPEQFRTIREIARMHNEATVEFTDPKSGVVEVYRRWGTPGPSDVHLTRYHPDGIVRWISERSSGGFKGLSRLGAPTDVRREAKNIRACSVHRKQYEGGQAFILHDGRVVPLPNGHATILRCMSDQAREVYRGNWYGVIDDAIAAGLVRIDYNARHAGLRVETQPDMTTQQRATLQYLLRYSTQVLVDVDNDQGKVVRWREYQDAKPGQVMAFIMEKQPMSGLGLRVAMPAGSPKGRLHFHWSAVKFANALQLAKKCGGVQKRCVREQHPVSGTMVYCTWRNKKGIVVAASAGPQADTGRATSLWTDRQLLAGKCPSSGMDGMKVKRSRRSKKRKR